MEFALQSFIILVLCDLCAEKKSHFTLHRQWIQALFLGIQIEISSAMKDENCQLFLLSVSVQIYEEIASTDKNSKQ